MQFYGNFHQFVRDTAEGIGSARPQSSTKTDCCAFLAISQTRVDSPCSLVLFAESAALVGHPLVLLLVLLPEQVKCYCVESPPVLAKLCNPCV